MKPEGKCIAFLIPVKKFGNGKSRLMPVFPDEIREDVRVKINTSLFLDMMDALVMFNEKESNLNIKVLICSSDEFVCQYVKKLGDYFIYIDENDILSENVPSTNCQAIKLDEIINFMNNVAVNKYRASGTVLLMGDLPLLTMHDLQGLFKNFPDEDSFQDTKRVVISPSLGNGCNMIARFPPNIIDTRYSQDTRPSFIEHVELAKAYARIHGEKTASLLYIYKNLGIYLDLDTPEDLMNLYPLLLEVKPQSRLLSALRGISINIKKTGCKDSRKVDISLMITEEESC